MDIKFELEEKWKTAVIANTKNLRPDEVLFKPIRKLVNENKSYIWYFNDIVAIPINVTPEEILIIYRNENDLREILNKGE